MRAMQFKYSEATLMDQLPFLDYDRTPKALLNPDHDLPALKNFPQLVLLAFLTRETIDKFVTTHNGQQIAVIETVAATTPIFQISWAGTTIALCQAALGAPAAVLDLDLLIAYGAKTIVAVGSCGELQTVAPGTVLIPTAALRDEGTSYHYLPAAPKIKLNSVVYNQLAQVIQAQQLTPQFVKTWTTDGYFRETQQLVQQRTQAGYTVVEMECAALAACAQFRQVAFGQLLFTADTMTDLTNWQPRDFGRSAHAKMLHLSIQCLATFAESI